MTQEEAKIAMALKVINDLDLSRKPYPEKYRSRKTKAAYKKGFETGKRTLAKEISSILKSTQNFERFLSMGNLGALKTVPIEGLEDWCFKCHTRFTQSMKLSHSCDTHE